MIVDPVNPQIAIDPATAKLAVSLRILPPGAIKDLTAPTVAELALGVHIGWTKGIQFGDIDDTR